MAERKLDNSNIVPGASPNGTMDATQKPPVSHIVTGAVVVPKKKSVAAKLRETFIGEDVGNIKNYIIWEVVVPSIRNALLSTFHGCTDMLFGGGKKAGYNSYNPYVGYGYQNPYIQYSQPRYGYQQPVVANPSPTSVPQQPPRNSRDVGKILFKTRADADLVAETLRGGILATYGTACVRDLYELVGGVELQATDNNWGWRDLSTMSVRVVPEGYLLELPAPIYLNQGV